MFYITLFDAAYDIYYRDEIMNWQIQGNLARLDIVFFHDGEELRCVQDGLQHQADMLRAWQSMGALVAV
ncbi:MAG: hypothetical protein WCX90_07105 [Thiohalomonadaceae bacterium]|jgi:sulfite reductase (NADPH) flavoprotein alpha-component